MADIITITLPDQSIYNVKDIVSRSRFDVQTGTGTAGQAGSSSKAYIPALWKYDLGMTPVAGDIITITVPVAGVSSGVWVSVDNGAHYYPIAVNNKTRLTTQYAIDNQITLIYQEDMVTTTYGTDTTGAAAGASAADLTSDRWVVLNYYDANTTYSNASLGQGYGTCATAAATAAKEVTLSSYALTTGGIVAVKFTYDVPANATMNINAKGAKAIYYKGAKITAGVIKAGDVAYFIYSSYYHLLGIDRMAGLSSLAAASSGTAVSLVTTGEKYTWNNKVTSVAGKTGTVTLTNSDVGLGNVENKSSATIRGELTSSNVTTALGYTPLNSNLKGANNGLAELGSDGKVPSSQLPSYVDDVLEYASQSAFPATGESGKIYITQDTNKTYRWSGTAYVEISESLALGTTSSTAFRGDYGNSAYAHAVTNKGSAFTSGMYKITTNSEGHVTAATAVQKSDITGLGITELPSVTTSDNGKVLRVVSGAWAAASLPSASGVSF